MQFILNEGNNLYGYAHGDKSFEFPTNIKQVGCIDDGIRIYMEDYVYTYLFQYAKTGGNKEKLAALIGKHIVIDEQEVIIISGAIQGKNTISDKGVEAFTDETWNYINNQMEVYFKGLSVLGWMHTQPGFGAFLMSRDEIFHRECFTNPWQVLYVLDPIEKLDTFYVHNCEKTGLKAAKGYFVYYDKNEKMQEYMLDNSLVKPRITVDEQKELNINSGVDENENVDERILAEPMERMDAAAKIRRVLKQKLETEEINGKKSRYTILASISGILCIVCLMMSASLMSSASRINKLENEVVSFKTTYEAIAQQIQANNTVSVYAEKNEDSVAVSMPKSTVTEKIGGGVVVEAQAAENKQETAVEEQNEEVTIKDEKPVKEEQDTAVVEEVNVDIMQIYTVEEGDNLGYISFKFYGTDDMVDKIMEVNGFDNADMIFYGKELILPKQ